jgi:AraC-like DNA-binding protein
LQLARRCRTRRRRRNAVSTHWLAALAIDLGYYDQSHFNRDLRRFAGVIPRALIENRSVLGPGFDA